MATETLESALMQASKLIVTASVKPAAAARMNTIEMGSALTRMRLTQNMSLIIITMMIMSIMLSSIRVIKTTPTPYLICSFVTGTERMRTRTGLPTLSMSRMTCI